MGPAEGTTFVKEVSIYWNLAITLKEWFWEENNQQGSLNAPPAQALRGTVSGKPPKRKPHPGVPRWDRNGLWLWRNTAYNQRATLCKRSLLTHLEGQYCTHSPPVPQQPRRLSRCLSKPDGGQQLWTDTGKNGIAKETTRDFPGGPVVKNLPSNAGDARSIPGCRTKIPHATGQLSHSCWACARQWKILRDAKKTPLLQLGPDAVKEINQKKQWAV